MNPRTPFGYALFCDDIRREIGNKTSLLGLYSAAAFFEAEFPISIPKFCVVVNWIQHRDDERRPIKVRVHLESDGNDDQTVIEADIPIEGFDQALRQSPADDFLQAMIHIVLTPFVVERPGKLKVRAFYGDDEYRLGSLRLLKATEK